MHILPVLDLKQGIVVRGIAGRRHEYKPLQSCWTHSTEPLAVAQALHDAFGFRNFYLADLDAIGGDSPAWPIYERMLGAGLRLLVDAGVRNPDDGRKIILSGADCVLGLETVEAPDVLAALLHEANPDRFVFSLDLKEGVPLARFDRWRGSDPPAIASEVIALGIGRLIILDLAQVGVGKGVGTEDLCRQLHAQHPEVGLIAGGGIRGIDDLDRLSACGVSQALVASALHDERLKPQDLARLG